MLLRKLLWQNGHRGYRLHYKKVPGRPDISFVGRKLAIFVHGCFWHRCPTCNYSLPKTNQDFWTQKFERNVSRDQRKVHDLELLGWQVITVWECDLKNHADRVVETIQKALN